MASRHGNPGIKGDGWPAATLNINFQSNIPQLAAAGMGIETGSSISCISSANGRC
jgi:hypothetical protein